MKNLKNLHAFSLKRLDKEDLKGGKSGLLPCSGGIDVFGSISIGYTDHLGSDGLCHDDYRTTDRGGDSGC